MNKAQLARGRNTCAGAASGLALAASLLAGQAVAQTEPVSTAAGDPSLPAAAPAAPAAQPSEVMVVNLIRLLVKQGVITQSAADALLQQAQQEADQAKLAAAGAPSGAAPPPGVIRVPYVPQVVQDQIRDDVKKDVMAQAKAEGWASPGEIPAWTKRFSFFGDFRFRDEFDFYSSNNYPNPITPGGFIDYSAFNANGPTDVNPTTNPNGIPFLNTHTNRINQLSYRARIGMNVNVFDGVKFTVRLASGNDNSPVSTTQLLGGGLTKNAVWLDQAYLTLTPNYWASIEAGRFPNPFFHTTLQFDDNLNFDGLEGTAATPIGTHGLKVFGTAAVVPVGYVNNNFPTDNQFKAGDRTSWLFAAQAGAQYQPDELSWSIKGAVAFYGYDNIQGQLSAPCDIWDGNKQCSTDMTRPAFMQKGNSLFFIRDILPNPSSPTNYAQPQFAGLSYNYNLIDVLGQFEMPMFGTTRGQLQGEFVSNLSYDPSAAFANPLTHPVTNFDVNGTYKSGPNAWMVKATVGYIDPGAKGDWQLVVGYKYIEGDAVLDAFNDHDFHQGGTNAKGYFVTAAYYFANNTWIDGRWFSANQVSGVPLAIDVLQLELNTRF